MEEDGGLGISNWGYYEASSKGNLGLRLMPSMAERDVKPLLTTGGFLHRHCATPEPPVQMNSVREGWSYHSCDNGKGNILRDGWNRHGSDASKDDFANKDGWFQDANGNSRSFPILPVSHEHHPGFGFLTDPPTHSLQVLQLEEPRPKDDNTPTAKKRTRSRQRKSPKTKKPEKLTATSDEVPSGSLSNRKVPRKGLGMVINGIDFDISRIPTPVCSCTGKPQPCYRWGVGGWQSACCTTSISMYPLPMNTKRRGARIAGRKMSQGAFKKVLEKLAGEGYNLSNPIDLRSFWAKHGTNKYVTIRQNLVTELIDVAMDDVSRDSNGTTFHGARPPKAERSKRRGGGRKAKKWFCKIVPSIEGCAKPPDADPPTSKQQQPKKKKQSPRGGCSCCPGSSLCGRKAGERTSRKQIPPVEISLRDAGAVFGQLPTRKTTDVVNVVVNEVAAAQRSKPADHAFDALFPRKPVEENTGLAERLPPPSKGHASAAVVPERLPPGPARDLPVPNPIVGQEVCLKTALSYLANDAVGIMGIYGTGGVGKTTLLRSINNKFCGNAARTEFDHVILIAVGKDPDVKKLQRDIAYEVGLLLMDDESEVKRAATIFDFLKTKNFLLLLDDLWGPLELARVGIPHPLGDGHKRKVIISSRLMDVAGRMQAHKILILECLKWEEAWNLFSSKVGEEDLADRRIRSIAVALAKECGGLPLALVAMGSAMSTKKTLVEWQKAVSLLKNAPLHESSGYQMLKENLIRAWMGLGSITDLDDINEAYNIGYSIIESLKAASLMENSEKSYRRMEMHDVIREMALWTASGKESGKNKWLVGAKTGETRSDEWSKAERISLMFNEIEDLPDSCYCPNLQSLILRGNKRLMKIPNGLFPCMVLLRFLDLSHTGIVELPNEVGTLINLQFLNLSYTKIACLPKEMKELTTLKYLELEGTRELRKIHDGVISSLEMLQELNLYMSGFANWSWLSVCSQDSITFEELVSLQRLRSVGFTVRNIQCLLRLFSIIRVSTHSLTIRELRGLISLHLLPGLLSKNKMGRLKNLTIESSQGLKELAMGEEAKTLNWRLYQLEVFNLVCLPELERVIWRGVAAHVCLPNLRFLSLFYCNSLKNIAWVAHLPLLQELYIQNCNEMEQVIADEPPTTSSEKEEKPMTSFPNLKYIFLRDLKSLVKIDDQVLEFPCLERILVHNCIELKQLPLGAASAQKLRIIFGERNWWESLEWGDQSIKSTFTTCFREIPAGYEPSMKILEGL